MAGGISRGVIWVVLAAIALVASPRPARACAPAPHAGESVRIFEEEALIVWDAKTKTQHFIRRAAFDTQAKDFGFLVPTPEKPELAEADDSVFFRLAQAIAPKVEWKVEHPLELGSWLFGMMLRGAKSEAAIASVDVLAVARVAGFDAVVLRANDADAMAGWLEKHGYEFGPDLRDWLDPYVKASWKITAFKIAKDASGRTLPELGTEAVRMSFKAEQPYFPYREPASQRATILRAPILWRTASGAASCACISSPPVACRAISTRRVDFRARSSTPGRCRTSGSWPARSPPAGCPRALG